jgi:hypothetical protein
MPYELSFTKRVTVEDDSIYINACCWGGDVIRDHLLPLIRGKYQQIQTEQEDWGWFIWFKQGPVSLAIDIHTDDPETGAFRIILTSRKKELFFSSQEDTPQLEHLLDLVIEELERWAGPVKVEPMK